MNSRTLAVIAATFVLGGWTEVSTGEPRFSVAIAYAPDELCLIDSVATGLRAVVLNPNGIGAGMTDGWFHLDSPLAFTATRLVDIDTQLLQGAGVRGDGGIAVVGSELSDVQVKRTKLLGDADVLDARARELLCDSLEWYSLAGTPPMMQGFGDVVLLIYDLLQPGDPTPLQYGPAVLWLQGALHVLPGACTNNHMFFSVRGVLHLAYYAVGCNSGECEVLIYDVSGAVPTLVYANGSLGV